MSESILVYSGKSFKDMQNEGGIAWWVASQTRAEKLEYALVTRCLTQEYATHDVEAGTAIMLCKLNGVVRKDRESNRKCLVFSSYAKINIPNVWQKITGNQQNPIKYIDTAELLDILKLELNKLEWLPFNK